ncbi:glycohydrolase toxin TNT-related protein [Lysinibacillus xylanilyticus]|uniref:glycohydrolase toxin TNT-related protein n=1 Tax=Lysinibacillus xylanilyticus TaxID=582475 RepID=UPI00381EE2B2
MSITAGGDLTWTGKSISFQAQETFRIVRYGYDTGTFVSPESIPYEMRAVAPGTDLRPYSIVEVVAPIGVKEW